MCYRLQAFADQLVDRFVAHGIMVREFDRVKLHITVMNSLMRNNSSHAIVVQSGRASTRARESFDATRLVQVIIIDFLQKLCRVFFAVILKLM